jgi:hypothetical protein
LVFFVLGRLRTGTAVGDGLNNITEKHCLVASCGFNYSTATFVSVNKLKTAV